MPIKDVSIKPYEGYERSLAMTHLETLCQRFLWTLVQCCAETPDVLRDSVLDHLTRTDATRMPLCFYSPTREQLFDLVLAWGQSARQ
jgi:hypothetical protein